MYAAETELTLISFTAPPLGVPPPLMFRPPSMMMGGPGSIRLPPGPPPGRPPTLPPGPPPGLPPRLSNPGMRLPPGPPPGTRIYM